MCLLTGLLVSTERATVQNSTPKRIPQAVVESINITKGNAKFDGVTVVTGLFGYALTNLKCRIRSVTVSGWMHSKTPQTD